MEVLKKKIKLITTTASTVSGINYIPDTTVNYEFKILLTSNIKDYGFFDTYEDENANNIDGLPISNDTYEVTGTSKSRLNELKKFSTSTDLNIGYFTSTSSSVDGVNILLSDSTKIVYYIGGITYTDYINNNMTVFNFISLGYNSPQFENKSIYKDFSKETTIEKPEVSNDVFIVRQSLSVFQNIYRLQDIENISQLDRYAGGAKFNIINNI